MDKEEERKIEVPITMMKKIKNCFDVALKFTTIQLASIILAPNGQRPIQVEELLNFFTECNSIYGFLQENTK